MLRSLFGRSGAVEPRAMQVTPWGPWGTSYTTADGRNVTPDGALQMLTVMGCVSLISDTIATLPRDIFKKAPDGSRVEVKVRPRWFDQPNGEVDIVGFLTQTLSSLLLDGNAYWAYGLDGSFMPNEIYVLDPLDVQIRVDRGQVEYWVRGQRFQGRMHHIKGLMRPGSQKGLSPVEYARQSIGIGLAAQDFASDFYKNGAVLSGVIETPNAMTMPQARELKQNFQSDHSGRNAHTPGVLTNGATYKPLGVAPEQAQFLATRNFQAAEICSQMFLLDPSMLGISPEGGRNNLTYANLEQRGIHLVQYTLMRWLIRLENAFTYLLPRPQYMKFNVNALMRADLKTRYEAHRIALGANVAWETVNEVRTFEEKPKIAGQDDLPEQPTPPAPAPPSDQQPPDKQQNTIIVQPPEIRVPPAIVHVNVEPADVKFEPTIEVQAAEAPIVNFTPPDIRVDVQPTPITVEAAEAPIIHFTPPEMHVDVAAPVVNVETPVVNVEPPVVHYAPPDIQIDVAAPEVVVESPTVNVEPTVVNFTPPDIQVDVAAPTVEVAAPVVNVEAAEIVLPTPEIRVEAPIVNVPAPNIQVDAPIVNVPPSNIRIDAPQIHMPKQGKIRRTFERDEKGITVAVIEEPIEEVTDEAD